MAEQKKNRLGDGSDNYAGAVKEAGKTAVKETAKKSAEATSRAAAATVKASAEGGKAAGTAAGGPVGAAISVAWSMRHTLFKILICVCLSLTFLINDNISPVNYNGQHIRNKRHSAYRGCYDNFGL